MSYIIRDKSRSYGVFDERYATREEAKATETLNSIKAAIAVGEEYEPDF